MPLDDDLQPYAAVIDRFLCGTMPRLNHARHLDIANILVRLPNGRALVHLGLQITAIRAGVPEKYSASITDHYLDALDGHLPPLDRFADIL
jgi:hypothetical protein